MPSSGMLRRVAVVRTDVSEERIASISRVRRIALLGSLLRLLVTSNVVPCSPILATLVMEAVCSSEISVLIRDTRRNIEDGILYIHRRKSPKSYIAMLNSLLLWQKLFIVVIVAVSF
jgi:hypothetical protein